jgi:type IX secretion system PorP/SprF family membrane protein
MKKCFIICFNIFLAAQLYSQQYLQVSQYMNNNLMTNAGSAGSKDMICAGAIYRQQMVGFPGAPINLLFNVEVPFNLFGASHGVGLSIYRDEIGYYKDNDLKISYAYRFNVGEGSLGIGIGFDVLNRVLDATGGWIEPYGANPDDYSTLPQESQTPQFTYNISGGLFYRTEDFYIGASAVNLTENLKPLEYESNGTNGTAGLTDKINRHYFVTSGYNMQMANPAYEIRPSVFIKSDGRTTSLDLTGLLVYNKKFWGGVSYRPGAAIIGIIGIDVMDGIKIGYSYDFATTALTKYSQGSHEFSIKYCFKIGIEKSPQKYKSIRFL